jgi:poly(A) polymerase
MWNEARQMEKQGALSVAGSGWFEAPETRALFAALNVDGHETRAVGGAVRNTLMGLPVREIDFATTATPEEVAAFARKAGLKPVPTGVEHGTMTVVVEGQPFEVTTLRRDVETFGRHASVKFTRDWAMDASRRDFTINALYASADGAVHDPLGGYPDVVAKRVRFIGSARERIREDYLRILRFFRFTADYGRDPDAEGMSACIAERDGLRKLSAERIRAELLRILAAREPLRALEPMSEAGFLTSLLGGVVRIGHVARMVAIEAENGLPRDPVRGLGALGLMVEEDARRLTERLRLSNAESARLETMAAAKPVISGDTGALAIKAALYRLGQSRFCDRLLIAWARSGATPGDAAWRAHLALPDRWQPPSFPLRGEDLIAAGIERGPKLGALLRQLEEAWISSDFTLDRAGLLALLPANEARRPENDRR